MLDLSLREEKYLFTLSYVMWQMRDKGMWLQNLFYFCSGIMVLDGLIVMVLVDLYVFLYPWLLELTMESRLDSSFPIS